jgi:hypothetical protein
MHRRRWISTSSVQIEESAQVHNIFFSKESARVSDFRLQCMQNLNHASIVITNRDAEKIPN